MGVNDLNQIPKVRSFIGIAAAILLLPLLFGGHIARNIRAFTASASSAAASSQTDDLQRRTDLATIQKALEAYYQKYGTYLVTGTGWSGSGEGYVSLTMPSLLYTKSIIQGLAENNLLSTGFIDDPDPSKQPNYMLYLCNGNKSYALSATLQNPTAADVSSVQTSCNGTGSNGTYTIYEKNYAVSGSNGVSALPPPVPPPAPPAATTLYVSPSGSDTNAGTLTAPFQTVTKAQEQVQALRSKVTGNIVVYLRGGTYYLSAPLTFGPQDGGLGSQAVTYSSYPGETAILSGGTAVNTFSSGSGTYAFSGAKPDYLFTTDPTEPRPAPARIPNKLQGYFYVSNFNTSGSGSMCAINSMTLTYSGGESISNVFTPQEIGAIAGSQAVLIRPWEQTSATVGSDVVNGSTLTVYFNTADAQALCAAYDLHLYPGMRVYFRGQKAFMQRAGDWAYDGGTVYYMGASGSDLVVPRLATLIAIQGTVANPVRNLVLSNLVLRDAQTGVSVQYASDIRINGSHLLEFGGNGVTVQNGTADIAITNNVIEDIGATGIFVSTYNITNGSDPTQIASSVDIENNLIQNIGLDASGHGIFAYYLPGGIIRHNTVRYLSYIGIGLGQQSLPDVPSENGLIDGNDVGYAMQIQDDGGAIYVAGKGAEGTVISNNYMHDVYSLQPTGFFSILRVGLYIDGLAVSVDAENNNLVRNATNGIYVQTQLSPDWRVRNSHVASYLYTVDVPLDYDGFSSEAAMRATLYAVGTVIQYAVTDVPYIANNAGVSASVRALWPQEFARQNRFTQ